VRPRRRQWSGRSGWIALALSLWACVSAPPAELPPRYFEATPAAVLEAAVSVLNQEGYVLGPVDPNINLVTGQQERTITRARDGLVPGTLLTTQIVVEADESGTGTQLRATFSIRSRRPTGEVRLWVPESPLGQRLRSRFFAALNQELGLGAAAESPER
jgi:hypothetical protein